MDSFAGCSSQSGHLLCSWCIWQVLSSSFSSYFDLSFSHTRTHMLLDNLFLHVRFAGSMLDPLYINPSLHTKIHSTSHRQKVFLLDLLDIPFPNKIKACKIFQPIFLVAFSYKKKKKKKKICRNFSFFLVE